MLKQTIAGVAAAAVTTAALPMLPAVYAEAAVNNTVSGYVSLTEGVKIAGADDAPTIHIDEGEYTSVVRAVGDLAEDIEAVTGKKAEINNDSITHYQRVGGGGISINEGKMSVWIGFPVPGDSDCYIAAYDESGRLASAAKADSAYGGDQFDDGSVLGFNFDKLISKPEKGEIKAFVWSPENEPVTSVMGMLPYIALEEFDVIIGTVGASETIDALTLNGSLDISEIEGKWESFTIQNVDNTVVIAGSDKRGTIYGIYDLCEKMGVSPWSFWADVKPEKAEELYINLSEGGYTEGESSVKYRGIFLNDEYNFNKWTNSEIPSNVNSKKYERVYELMLRLKLNTLWPAMHNYSTAFHNVEGAAELADKYGIVMGSSHAEPLLRNNLGELDAFQDEWEASHEGKKLYKALKNESGKSVAYYWTDKDADGNAVDNKEFLEDYWRASVKANGEYDNIYTLGMRGVHDGSFQTNMDYATALNEIISTQYRILKEEIADKQDIDVTSIPKVFIPYKDIQSLYNQGKLKIPDDVTIMWTDDNYGYMRQNANDAERSRSGGTGVYYHISYYGWPTSYLWLSSTQPGLIREELVKAYDMGAENMWILNVGDLKPAEKEIEYYARLARNVDDMRDTDIDEVYRNNAKRDFNFSGADAAEYADMMKEYYELANAKRPDFYRTDDADSGLNISVSAYGDEGERYVNRYKAIANKAEELYNKLPEDKQPSFFELALYPIRSAKNMSVDFISADKAKLYKTQGRGSVVNRYANEANEAAAQITADTKTYNTMLDGKWNNMVVINPAHFTSCDAHITTELAPSKVTRLEKTAMEIAVEGQTSLTDAPTLTLSPYDSYYKYIDIINTGYGSFDYKIASSNDAIVLSKTEGTVNSNDRVYVSLKANDYVSGDSTITIVQMSGDEIVDSKEIAVKRINQSIPELTRPAYIETDGTVSIEAEHYSDLVSVSVDIDAESETNEADSMSYEWRVERGFGRSGDSLKIYPNLAKEVNNTAADVLANSAYAEYDIYFSNAGTYNVNIYRMPTLNERGYARVAVGMDGGDPVIINGTNTYSGSRTKTQSWSNQVLKNTEVLKTTLNVSEAGVHTLRLYNVSAGMVIDKIVLVKGAAPASYFGAPESYNTKYNTAIEAIPAYTDKEAEDGATRVIIKPDSDGEPVSILSEDFENGSLELTKWHKGSNCPDPTIKTDNTSYADLTASGSTVGAYMNFDEINAVDKKFIIEADVKFTQSGVTGNAQFSIGNTSPKFSSNNINWGIIANNAHLGGHILGIEYNAGKTLLVNGQTADAAFAADWMHVKATADFGKKTIDITISDKEGSKSADFNGISLYSTSLDDNIGSMYLRAAGSNGSASVDNLNISEITSSGYAINISAVDETSRQTIENAQITVTNASGETFTAEKTGEFAGKYLLPDGKYTIKVTADGYRTVTKELDLNPSLESKEVQIEMASSAALVPAKVTIKTVDEENNTLKDDVVITEGVYAGDNYEVLESLTKNFVLTAKDGKMNYYAFNALRSQTSAALTADTVLRLEFNMTGQYDYYEDFEDYSIESKNWTLGDGASLPSVMTDDTRYVRFTGGSGSTGAYTNFNEINTEGKNVKITADVRFEKPLSGKGLSQFSIGNTASTFSGNKISYGVNASTSGHVLVLEYNNNGSTQEFKVNGQVSDMKYVGDWVHVEADANFTAQTAHITISNAAGDTAEFDTGFYSAAAAGNLGMMYLRGTGSQGTVDADNITITVGGDADYGTISVLNGKTVYDFGDSIVYGHTSPSTAFMPLLSNKYGMRLTVGAKNGATIVKSSNDVITQVNAAPAASPDFVVFDGYTNDAYGDPATDTINDGTKTDVTTIMGEAKGAAATEFDDKTFCGAFEKTLYTMKQKWPEAKIVFVTIHKSGGRNLEIQQLLREKSMEMCEAWGVDVVDMFTYVAEDGTTLDTTDPAQMKAYIMNGSGSHPNVEACKKYYIPAVYEKLVEIMGGEVTEN